MEFGGSWQAIDVVGAAVIGVALLRGLLLGLVREAFSLAALGGACIAARLYASPLGERLATASGGEIPAWLAPWLAGVALALLVVVGARLAARFLRLGLRAVGLRWVDRLGGGLLGAAEGALVLCAAVAVGSALVGRDHGALAGSRSLAALEQLEVLVADRGIDLRGIDVAAPPRR